MPCWTVTTVGVELGKVNAEIMIKALVSLSLAPSLSSDGVLYFGSGEYINTKTGQSRLQQMRDVGELKRAYSQQVVKLTAAKKGWTLKVDQKNPNKMQAFRR